VERWIELNAKYAGDWPNIAGKKEPPAEGKAFDGVAEKFEKYFSPEPGQ
jgi:ferredoxin